MGCTQVNPGKGLVEPSKASVPECEAVLKPKASEIMRTQRVDLLEPQLEGVCIPRWQEVRYDAHDSIRVDKYRVSQKNKPHLKFRLLTT